MNTKVNIIAILNKLEQDNIEYVFNGNKNESIFGFSSLFNYRSNTITFISSMYNFNEFYEDNKDIEIQLIITSSSDLSVYKNVRNIIQVKEEKQVFFKILDEFYDDNQDLDGLIDYHQTKSYISDKAKLGKNVKVGIGCIIEPDVYIGDNTEIHHNVVIRSKTKIGQNCTIYSGTVIGERGFNPLRLNNKELYMVKHYAGVTIRNNVHIGVNCSIHKGTIDDTLIEQGVKLNTMVHVAHNSIIGKNTVVTMPTQICGSVIIGENCHIAATTIRNQCKIGSNATLGLGSVIVKDVKEGEIIVGNPGKPLRK